MEQGPTCDRETMLGEFSCSGAVCVVSPCSRLLLSFFLFPSLCQVQVLEPVSLSNSCNINVEASSSSALTKVSGFLPFQAQIDSIPGTFCSRASASSLHQRVHQLAAAAAEHQKHTGRSVGPTPPRPRPPSPLLMRQPRKEGVSSGGE